jgi:sortase A
MGPRFRRKVLSPLLLLLGSALLVYVASEYFSMYQEQKDLTEKWQLQALEAAAAPHTESAAAVPATEKLPAPVHDALVRVVIPRISLDAIVVEGVTKEQLAKGPGHMTETPTPGEPGNSVITAHRDTFFRHIVELEKGDDVLIRRQGQLYRFQVTGKKIVWPTEVSVIRPTPDARLTLITCYPTYYIGPAPKRLVVFSKLIDTRADVPGQPVSRGAAQ